MTPRDECLPRTHRGDLSAEDQDFVDIWGTKVGLQMVHGNREAALATVDRGLAARATKDTTPFLSLPLAMLGIDKRACGALEKYRQITTVEQFLQSDMTSLRETPQVGPRTVDTLLQNIALQALRKVAELEFDASLRK